jgi:hypothetical protein
MQNASDGFDNITAPTHSVEEVNEFRKKNKTASIMVTTFCGKMLGTETRGRCVNQDLPDDHPKSCANCIQFRNFEEEKK